LDTLEIFAAVDLYMNETNKYAHYLLPATTMYEREDARSSSPTATCGQFRITEKVIEPVGQAREEWQVLDEICKRMGLAARTCSPSSGRWPRSGWA